MRLRQSSFHLFITSDSRKHVQKKTLPFDSYDFNSIELTTLLSTPLFGFH